MYIFKGHFLVTQRVSKGQTIKDQQAVECRGCFGAFGIPKFPPHKKDWRPKKGKRAFTTLQRNYVEAANTRKKRDSEKANHS